MAKKVQKITKENLSGLIGKLEKLPPKEPDAYSCRRAVLKAAPQLIHLLGNGYSYEELTSILSDSGVKVKTDTLKSYIQEARKALKNEPSSKKKALVSSESVKLGTNHKPKTDLFFANKESEAFGNFVEMDEKL